jgi:hypothetical protein
MKLMPDVKSFAIAVMSLAIDVMSHMTCVM